MAVWKMIGLVLSLGMDTLMMSMSLRLVNTKDKIRIALVFACAEALMPLVGLWMGQGASRLLGTWASFVGGMALVAIAIWFIFFADEDGEQTLGRNLAGWALIVSALGISVDELAVGFSMGLVGVPIALTIILIAAQALAFTFLGLTFGAKLKPFLGEWSEKLVGLVLGLLGLWILIGHASELMGDVKKLI